MRAPFFRQAIVATLAIGLQPTAPALAQSTTPIADNLGAASYFEQSDCNGTPGLVTLFYPARYDVQDIAQACHDEAAGQFQFSFPLPNMTLVAQTPAGRRFEDLTRPSDADRSAINLRAPEGFGEFCGDTPEGYQTLDGLIYPSAAGGPTELGAVMGYLLDATSEPQEGMNYRYAFLAMSGPSKIDDIAVHEYRGDVDLSFAFEGSVTPHYTDTGTFVIQDSELANLGSYDGQVKIAYLGDGEVTMTGAVETTTSRIAGLEPNDWKAAHYELVGFRGNVFGDKGQFVQLYGWIEGSFIDESGAIHTFRGDASFQACGTPE